MRTEIAIISALALVLSVPLAFGQTDFEESNTETSSQFEAMVNQELPELGIFKSYDHILNDDGSYTMSTHYPYFETEQGEFIPYRLIQDDSMVQVEVDGGKFVFDKTVGALTVFNEDGIVINSDSYVVRQAELNTDEWNQLSVNNEPVFTTVEERENDVVVVSFFRENFEGLLKIEYVIASGSLKTTAYFTNNFFEDSKFAFTETIELPDSIISLNDMEEIDLSDFVGQTFPREVLEQNEDLILSIKDLYYNSGIGFDNLWSVTILENNKIVLDYANVEETHTAIGETVELDPSVTYGRDTSTSGRFRFNHYLGCNNISSNYWALHQTNTADLSFGRNANWCYAYFTEWNYSALPSGAIISSATMTSTSNAWISGSQGTFPFAAKPYTTNPLNLSASAQQSWLSTQTNGVSTNYVSSSNWNNITPNTNLSISSSAYTDLADGNVKMSFHRTNYSTSSGMLSHQGQYLPITITYTVPAVPDAVTPTASTSLGQNTVTWTQPNNNGATIDQYDIYGNGVYLHSINNSPTTTSWTHTNPVGGTPIYYQVYSHNSVGWQINAPNSNTVTPASPPSQVTNLAVSQSNGDQVNLTWSAPSNGGSALTSYSLFPSTGSTITGISGSATSYTWTAPTSARGQSVNFFLVPYNAIGNGGNSNNPSLTMWNVPSTPSVPTATFVSNTSNTVTWTAPANGGTAITNYELFRNGNSIGNVGNVLTYTDTGLTIGSSNFYSLKAINVVGSSSLSSNSNTILNANAPDAPTNLVAVTGNPITMTWTAPSSDMTITNYKIYRDGSLIDTIGAVTSYTDNTTSSGTTYSYEVSAVSVAGEGNKSNSSSAIHGVSADPPSLALTHNSSNLNINIGITNGSSMGTGTLTNYTIERSADGSTGWTSVGTPTITSFTDTVPNTGTWYYRANTITNHGTSGYSSVVNIAHVDPDAPSITSASYNNPANSNIEVAITNGASFGTGDFTSYTIERSADGSTNWTSAGTATTSTFIDTNVPSVGDWYYRVATNTPHGTSAFSSNGLASPVAPDAPTNLTSVISNPNPSPLTVSVGWTAPTNFGSGNLTGYEVYRDGSLITTTGTSTGYTDTVPSAGTFVYTVKTVTAHATSVLSASTSITTPTVPVSDSSVSLSIDNPNPNPLDITVSFVAPSSDGGSAVVSYDLHSSPDNITYTQIATGVTADQTVTVSSAGTWYFKSLSTNNVGSSTLGSAVSITTPSVPTGDASVTLAIPDPDGFPFNSTATFVAPSSNGGSAITGYNLFYSDDNVTYSQIATASNSVINQTLTGAGTHYFKVESINNVGTSALSSAITIDTPTVPVSDSSVTLSIDNPNPNPLDITVSFVAPSSDGGSAVLTYDLHSSSDNITFNQIATGVTADQTVTVSSAGTWYFKSLSTNNVGSSGLGSAVSITTPSVPTGDASVTLAIPDPDNFPFNSTATFVAPSSNGGSTVTGYNLYYSDDNITYSQIATASNSVINQTLTGAGTHYFKVESINNVGTSALSSAITIDTPTVPSADASATLAINNPNPSPLTITATFVAPSSDGGSAVIDYNLWISNDDVTYTQIATNVTGTFDTTVSQSGTYYFKVESTNLIGTAGVGSAISITTPTVPSSPLNASSVISDVNTAPYEVTVTWETPSSTGGSDLTQYNVYRKQGSGAYSLLTTTTGLSITDTVPTSLTTNFTYKIHSQNNVGESTTFDDTTITTFDVPQAPTLSVTTGTTVLSWNTPTSDGTVTNYKIYRDGSLVTTVGAVNTHSDFTPIVFGNSYDYKVVAVSSLGDSADSNTVTTTPETEITGMVALGVTGTGAVIDWEEPAYYQGQVTSYNVYYGNSGTPTTSAGTTTNTYNNFAPQLDYDTTYVFGVSINSPLGNSGLSNIVTITTNVDGSIVAYDPNTGTANWFDIDSVSEQTVNVIEFQRETQNLNVNGTFTDVDTLQVGYPSWWDQMTCDVDYKFAQKTEQYVEGDDMTAVVNSLDANQQVIGFQFHDIDNEVIEVECAPQVSQEDDEVSAKYIMTQQSSTGVPNIPLVAQIQAFQTGDYGTDGDFGALDVVGLFVILISMVGFNRLNPIVGVLLSASLVFGLSFFGIISLPTVLVGVVALVIFLAWGITRNR